MTELAQESPIRPLEGLTIVAAGGLGPVAFCCMLLADLGAQVIVVRRPAGSDNPFPPGLVGPIDIMGRGQDYIELDLKQPADAGRLLDLVAAADAIIEGFRPGVMERLGLGPAECARRNPKIIYGRLTGWGQDGPLAMTAGHDINYLAVSGALDLFGEAGGKPVPPMNLLGDFAGSALFMAYGILAATLRRNATGEGAVIDGAMIDGVSAMLAQAMEIDSAGDLARPRGCNLLDGGAPFYGVYACADGKFVALGAVEPHFYRNLLDLLELPEAEFDPFDVDQWPIQRERLARVLATRARDEWIARAGDRDICLSPVLSLAESRNAEQMKFRKVVRNEGDGWQPAPAPRFSNLPFD